MYIGPTNDGSGLHNMVFEVVDNAVNEARGGHADLIEITLNADGSVTVSDNGRGLPVEVDENEWVSGTELIMTRLHTGGKFDQPHPDHLHGVGVCVVNALSEMLELRIWRDGAEWFMRFRHGITEAGLDRVGSANGRTGTKIKFRPSPEIFANTDFDFAMIERRAAELASLGSGFRIQLSDDRV
jgi:DNA gyrase subunit B